MDPMERPLPQQFSTMNEGEDEEKEEEEEKKREKGGGRKEMSPLILS